MAIAYNAKIVFTLRRFSGRAKFPGHKAWLAGHVPVNFYQERRWYLLLRDGEDGGSTLSFEVFLTSAKGQQITILFKEEKNE
jgi:hypothetical protein